ncbi:primosomal protein DnaI [Spiroplasma sp. TIUS-1]|uniref:ATP-binding protein n=1 Tax=Spiroplasma sp. TIUS-1 TaxID=216963 RepID=UPI001397049D|nr:ATP-binding protein [Spiroplasma sp. TIUS-1]QHX36096.1 primosomal protein DnaI [Spiroplasma sp. TIUS-1]
MKYTIDQVKKNSIIKKIIIENKVSDEFVEYDLTTLNRFISQHKECKNNGGIDKCEQNIKGKQLDLYFQNSQFYTTFVPCIHYLNDHPNYFQNQNLIFSDISLDTKFKSIKELILSESKVSETNSKNIAAIAKKVEDGMKVNKGIYIYGKVGVGKTEFLKVTANRFLQKGKKVVFIKTLTLTTKAHDEMFAEIKSKNTLNMCKYAEVLFLDDVGEEKPTTWKRDEILFNIIDYRYSHKLLTFFSSNLNLTKLRNKYSTVYDSKQSQEDEMVSAERIVDRIKGLVNEVEMLGKSRR